MASKGFFHGKMQGFMKGMNCIDIRIISKAVLNSELDQLWQKEKINSLYIK